MSAARSTSSRALFLSVATATTLIVAAAPLRCGAAPVDDLRAAVTAGGNSAVSDVKPKAFRAAVSAVLAGVPADEVPAYAAAAAGLRPDLADAIVHAAVSALHLPGQLPNPALVGALVKAVITAAPERSVAVATQATADAPEAREAIVSALTSSAPAQAPLFAKVTIPTSGEDAGSGSLPSSRVRLADGASAVAAPVTTALPAAATNGALNPANVSTPRAKRPPVSGF